MVQFLYFVALALALGGVAILASGEFAAMLDIGTSLIASAAVVAGLAAVAGGLHRIARTLHRFGEMAPETSQAVPERHFVDERPFAVPPAAAAAAPPWHGEQHPGGGWAEEQLPAEALLEPAIADARLPPEMARAPEPGAEPDSERVIRSGTLDGVLYRFYADGSVEAVAEHGPRRFASIEELKDEIIAARRAATDTPAKPEPDDASPEGGIPEESAPGAASTLSASRADSSKFERKAARAERRAAKMSSPRIETIEPAPADADEPRALAENPAERPAVVAERTSVLAERASVLGERSSALQERLSIVAERSSVQVERPSGPKPVVREEASRVAPAAASPVVEPVVAPPVAVATEAEPPPVPRPDSRLERFEEDIWAATLAELRRPFEDALAGRAEPRKTDEPPSRP